MNVIRYETNVHKEAAQKHQQAQRSGNYMDYLDAAELYEKCGDFQKATVCREAAEKLMRAGK